jgi:hypothetical protein
MIFLTFLSCSGKSVRNLSNIRREEYRIVKGYFVYKGKLTPERLNPTPNKNLKKNWFSSIFDSSKHSKYDRLFILSGRSSDESTLKETKEYALKHSACYEKVYVIQSSNHTDKVFLQEEDAKKYLNDPNFCPSPYSRIWFY